MSKFYSKIEQAGNRLLVVGYENGQRIVERVPFSPTLFIKTKNYSEYRTLKGELVAPVPQGSINDAKEFVKKCKNSEVEVYGNTRYLYQYIAETYPEDEIIYDSSKLRVFNIDIETAAENGFPNIASADQAILSISIKDSYTNRITVWGAKAFNNIFDDVDYLHFNDEQAMLTNFIHWWNDNFPDIITGWNVEFFDMPYIVNRVERILGDKYKKLLSPWKLVSTREVEINNKMQVATDILGLSILDYIQLYKKFTYVNQESYALNHICLVELDEEKLDHSEYDTFKEFYTNDWQKFIEYNIHDVRLVDRLDDKMKLLDLAITLAYDAKVNFEDVFSQVCCWDNYIYIELMKDNIVIPPKKEQEKKDKYAGAFVKEPIPGLYDWVVNFDLNSLYPHLIMQYNISPETLLPHRHPSANVDRLLHQEIDTSDLCGQALAPNGTFYDTSKQGFLPKMMQKMYDERVIYKKKMLKAKQDYEKNPTVQLKKDIARYNNIQMAKKISLNSAYGAIGNQYFRYYQLEMAEAITLGGQLSIRWIEKETNAHLNKILKTDDVDYVIAIDTDSMYLNLGPFVKAVLKGREKTDEDIVAFLDKVAQVELEPFIESSYEKLARYVNAYDQKMKMKRENIASRGFWTAKKRYALNVWNSEGVQYNEPKLKICGLETARSSVPQYFRSKLYEAYKIIINKTNEDLIKYIDEVREDARKQVYADLATPSGVNNLAKYRNPYTIYKKGEKTGTPIAVKGSLIYNYLLKKHKVEYKYQSIQEGEKVKYVYLKEPNPIGEKVISFFSEIPKEFNLDKYVSRTLQFEKKFLKPVTNVLDCIGWTTNKTVSVTSFF